MAPVVEMSAIVRVEEMPLQLNRYNLLLCTVRTSRQESFNHIVGCLYYLNIILVCHLIKSLKGQIKSNICI